MSQKPNVKLYQFFKSDEEITATVLTNTIKMLTARGLLTKSDLNKNISSITSKHPDDLIYKIKTKDNKLIVLLLFPQKITAVTKTSIVNDFLNNYKNNHKFIIVKNINKKAIQYIANNYPNSEIFLEESLMVNLIENVLVPEHQLLSQEKASEVYRAYKCTKKQLPRILLVDPVAKYYNMKPGDIFRIIRPSKTAGYGVTYRLGVKGVPNK